MACAMVPQRRQCRPPDQCRVRQTLSRHQHAGALGRGLAAEYGDGLWGTYKQWQEAGAQVRQGERSTTVVLWRETRNLPAAQ